MKKSFEDLNTLNHDVIVQKSHIAHSSLDDVIQKRFEKFNPVKAKGIASTLENEFDIDMSSWLAEYNAFRSSQVETISTIDKMALEAIQEAKIPRKKMLTIGFASVVGIFLIYLIAKSNPFSGLIGEQNITEEQFRADINKTEEANATNAMLNQSVDANGSVLPTVGIPTNELNATKTDANKTVAPKAPDAQHPVVVLPPVAHPTAVQPQAQTAKLLLETPKKLWYKVIYLDNNKTEETTIEPGKLELDGTRTKILIIGHQQNKITFGQTVIEPKAGAKIRYLVKDKKLTPISEADVFKLQGKPMPTSKSELESN